MISGLTFVANQKSKILILGSMPGIISLQENNYYAHPQNAFWWIMSGLLNRSLLDLSFSQRYQILKKNNIALWDVIEACERKGSLDVAINLKNFKPNDFELFLNEHKEIKKILCNGGLAYKLFNKLDISKKYQIYKMPSTSAAYAAMSKQDKLERWKIIFEEKMS